MTQWHGEGLGGYRQYLHSCRRRWSDHCVLHNDRVVLALVSHNDRQVWEKSCSPLGLLCSFLGAPHLCLEQAGTHGLYPKARLQTRGGWGTLGLVPPSGRKKSNAVSNFLAESSLSAGSRMLRFFGCHTEVSAQHLFIVNHGDQQ